MIRSLLMHRVVAVGFAVAATIAVVVASQSGRISRWLEPTANDLPAAAPGSAVGGADAGADTTAPKTAPAPTADAPAGGAPTGGFVAGESVEAAAISLDDDDGGSALFALANAAPGAGGTGCITVTYTGDAEAALRLYGTTSGTGLDAYLGLTITRGSFPAGALGFDSCAGFVADSTDYLGAGAGVVYSGTLAEYPDSYDTGVADPPGTVESWTDGETHAYQFAVSVADDNAAQGLDATQTFTWEARGEEPPAPSEPVPMVDPRSGPPGTIVTVASGSHPCVPPTGAVEPTVRVWIAAPNDGAVLHEITLPVVPDGSWSGTITIPEAAASFDVVEVWAACSDDGSGGSADTSAAAAAPYRLYSAVDFIVQDAPTLTPTPAPSIPADPAPAVPSQPTFVG